MYLHYLRYILYVAADQCFPLETAACMQTLKLLLFIIEITKRYETKVIKSRDKIETCKK